MMPPKSYYLVLAGAALLVVVTVVAYWPALNGGFIFDDDVLLTNNMPVKTPGGLYNIWFTTEEYEYYPISYSSLWLEWQLWGMNPTGYHVTNLGLHIAAVLLIWSVLRKLSIPGAFLAALLFAVHPVNVESVAWIAQRRDALAMLLFLASIWCYFRATVGRGAAEVESRADGGLGVWYWLSLAAFVLAMLSKGSVAVLPVVLLLIAWWRQGQITRTDLVRSIPFFFVAVALTLVNIWFETHGSQEVIREATLDQRLAGAGAVVWFYLSKALLPIHLIFVYPQWRIVAGDLFWWLPSIAALIVTAVLVWRRNSLQARWVRALLFAWLFYCVALAPVMGFADVGFMKFSLVADHYQHLAILGVVSLVAAGASSLWQRLPGPARTPSLLLAAIGIATLAGLCWRQSCLYADAITLYRGTLAENPECWMAYNNLGVVVESTGNLQQAVEYYQQALAIRPDYPEAHDNLGNVLGEQGKIDESLAQHREAIRLKPSLPEPYYNLGNALISANQRQAAIEAYHRALEILPAYSAAHVNLAIALAGEGRLQEAIEHYQQAVKLDPNSVTVQNNLGNALARAGRPEEAVEHLQAAVRLKPDSASIHNNLGVTLADLGRFSEAIEQYRQAIQLEATYAAAYFNLAKASAKLDRSAEAMAAAERGLALRDRRAWLR